MRFVNGVDRHWKPSFITNLATVLQLITDNVSSRITAKALLNIRFQPSRPSLGLCEQSTTHSCYICFERKKTERGEIQQTNNSERIGY